VLGDGFTVALRSNVWGGGPPTVTARVCAWAWDADKKVLVKTMSPTQVSKINERGYDLFFGLGAAIRVRQRWSGTVEYERYFLDGDPVDGVSLGFLCEFGV